MSTGVAASGCSRSRRAVAHSCASRSQVTSPATTRSIGPLGFDEQRAIGVDVARKPATLGIAIAPPHGATRRGPRAPNRRHSVKSRRVCPASQLRDDRVLHGASSSTTSGPRDRSAVPARSRSTSRAATSPADTPPPHVDADADDDRVNRAPSRPLRTARRQLAPRPADHDRSATSARPAVPWSRAIASATATPAASVRSEHSRPAVAAARRPTGTVPAPGGENHSRPRRPRPACCRSASTAVPSGAPDARERQREVVGRVDSRAQIAQPRERRRARDSCAASDSTSRQRTRRSRVRRQRSRRSRS